MLSLGKELPKLPECKVATVAVPTEDPANVSVLRVTIPYCFVIADWKQCQTKPANFVTGLLKDQGLQNGFICSYGWRSLDSAASW